jgi:hypothetical protein
LGNIVSDQPSEPQNALLGDLESIRDLFDEDQEERHEDPSSEDGAVEQVPLLDDVVAIPDAELAEPAQDDVPVAGPQMDDDLFQALLGDEWRTSAALVFTQAREKIEENSLQWAPEDTDNLNAALKIRIDETMQGWMRSMVIEHMANLHETLLEVLGAEMHAMIEDIITRHHDRSDENSDGQ